MAGMKEREIKYVAARAMGLAPKAAARQAGYAPGSIPITVTRLEASPTISAAILAATKPNSALPPLPPHNPFGLLDRYENSLEFMEHVMNLPTVPFNVRFEAAKTLMPFQNQRVGQKGKKETRLEDADKVSRGKFTSINPPALRVVK